MVAEDSPYRNHETLFPYQLSPTVDPAGVSAQFKIAPGTAYVNPSGFRAINRWADPESGNGVSGPPQADPTHGWYTGAGAITTGAKLSGSAQNAAAIAAGATFNGPYINQNMAVVGGNVPNVGLSYYSNTLEAGATTGCPWSANNCGPNDELNSSHSGGAYAVFCDGHVTLLKNNISGSILRSLVLPDDNGVVDGQWYQ